MRTVGAIAAALAVALTGCSSGLLIDSATGSINGITVTTDDVGNPVLDFTLGLTYTKVQTEVLWEGTGPRLAAGDRILLDWYAVSLQDGSVISDTYSYLPEAFLLVPELLGQNLYNELLGERIGTRLLQVSPPVEGHEDIGAMAVLVDVLPARATGDAVSRTGDIPRVVLGSDGTPTVTIPDGFTIPPDLTIRTLIQGHGDQVRIGSRILFNFVAVSLETGEVIATSWGDGEGPTSAQVGTGELIAGLDQGLVDATQGSQLVLLIPPGLAWGKDSVALVIDILAVRTEG
jgi:FKBP-type peptidyl-prolyl cis-trans isomerase 2